MKSQKVVYGCYDFANSLGFALREHLSFTGLLRSYEKSYRFGFPRPSGGRRRGEDSGVGSRWDAAERGKVGGNADQSILDCVEE